MDTFHTVSQKPPTSDVALLERVAAGDVRALWELSARHSLSLRALAFDILRDPVDAEQVVQATFREVRYEAARFDPAHFPVFGWLSELTRVGALQRSRQRQAGAAPEAGHLRTVTGARSPTRGDT